MKQAYTMKQALKISTENKENSYEQMKTIAKAYASIQLGMFCAGSCLPLFTRVLAEKGLSRCNLW